MKIIVNSLLFVIVILGSLVLISSAITHQFLDTSNNQLMNITDDGTIFAKTGFCIDSLCLSNFTLSTFNLYNSTWDNRGLINSNNLSMYNFVIYTNGTMKSYVDAQPKPSWVSSGNYLYNTTASVGIGTTSPSSKLEIKDSVAPIITLNNSDTSLDINQELGAINFGANDASSGGQGVMARIVGYSKSTGSLFGNLGFYTADRSSVNPLSEKMTIDYLGRVGIGTVDPSTKLEVNAGTSGSSAGNFSHTAISSSRGLGIFSKGISTTSVASSGVGVIGTGVGGGSNTGSFGIIGTTEQSTSTVNVGVFGCNSTISGCDLIQTTYDYGVFSYGHLGVSGDMSASGSATISGDLKAENNVWGTTSEYYITFGAGDIKCNDGDFLTGVRDGTQGICRSL